MKVWRALAHDPKAAADAPGGALWFPRAQQGASRHDNPGAYGCLYVSESPISTVAEVLAPFRGTGPLTTGMLTRGGARLSLACIEFAGKALDLDDPAVLRREQLRPSQVATRRRASTQADALRLHASHPAAGALRWWSTLDSGWLNLTIFDRAAAQLRLRDVETLDPDHRHVRAAATFVGLS